jgi:transglutaminase TgpA-like protein/transglutaminase superfamily protein
MSVTELELAEPPVDPGEGLPVPAPDDPFRPLAFGVLPIAVASFLAASAAGWVAGGLFRGSLARAAGLVAAALGAGIVGFAHRTRRPALWQALAVPAVGLVGFVLALAGGGGRGIAAAVADAIRGGGPSGEAMPFEPGWRLILVVLVGALAAGACSLGVALGRPRLAVLLPVPPLVAAAVVQPRGATVSSGIPALALLLGALVVSYSEELTERGASNRRFQARRIARGAVAIAGVVGLLFAMSRTQALFPVSDRERVIPPQLPPSGPALPDQELFTVSSTHPGPWRLGVLDVYDGTAWRLPPYDPARFLRVGADGLLPGIAQRAAEKQAEGSFTLRSLPGQALPGLAGAISIRAPAGLELKYDPRTQMLRAPGGTPPAGTTYEVTAAAVPTGKDLAEASAPRGMAEFLEAPAVPAEVEALLEKAPDKPLWDRLQYVRTIYYSKLVAAGAGKPAAVPPGRVVELLDGKPATPFEISAAEALLARWAGVPSRIGYGFFQGDRRGKAWSVRPRHAATWLEASFEGYGWVPIVGVPPRAQTSLGREQQQVNPIVRPTEQLALVLYVPVRLRTIRLAYVVARYWIVVAAPFILAVLAILIFYPGLLKTLRRARRSLWAGRAGPAARIAVAYAELRDTATDLNLASSTLTPLELVGAVAPDEELAELSWLVSRALWGDLRRDLRESDAETAERMARSVVRRIRRAQPGLARLVALASRASLRDPYTREIPNLWHSRRRGPRRRLRIRFPRRRRLAAAAAAVLAVGLGLTACSETAPRPGGPGAVLPDRLVPDSIQSVTFNREEKVESRLTDAGAEALIDAARVYTFRAEGAVQGYLQVGGFSPGTSGTDPDIRRGVLEGIGAARFKLTRLGQLRVYTAEIGRQNFALWFAPEGTYFELLVARRAYKEPLELLGRILEYQGRTVSSGGEGGPALVPADPRRGVEG